MNKRRVHLPARVTAGRRRVIVTARCKYVLPTQADSLGNHGKHTELIFTSCEPCIIDMLSPSSLSLFHSFRQIMCKYNHMTSAVKNGFVFQRYSDTFRVQKGSLCLAAMLLPGGPSMAPVIVERRGQRSY